MASVIVIGVGSTGLHVMEQAQRFYYQFTKQDAPNPNNAAFLFIETDDAKEVEKTPNGTTSIKSTNLSFENIDATLGNWHKAENKDWKDWMPTTAKVLASAQGAANQPAYGRIALWANEQSIAEQIDFAYQQVDGNLSTNIYIVGSLTGGTGTGVFLDLAYMVKKITNNDKIYGLFLLPDRNGIGNQSVMPLYENAYSSLRTLDYYSKPNEENNTNFKCTYPSGSTIEELRAPFYNVQFFSKDFSNAQASLPSLANLERSVGFNLVLRLLDVTNQAAPFQSIINARLIDYNGKLDGKGVFTTIGFNMFQYPEALLEEYFSADLLKTELLDRWVDANAFIDKNGVEQPITSVEGKIKVETVKLIETTIADIISTSMNNPILASSTTKREIEREVNNILNGDIVGTKENYIYSLFNPEANKANFYSAINGGQSFSLRDYLIDAIVKKIESISTEYQNINIVRTYISSLAEAIDKLLLDWKTRLKLDGTSMMWKKFWTETAKTLTDSDVFYVIVNAKKEYYVDLLVEMVKMCYINAFIPVLEKVSVSLLTGDILKTTSGTKLATLKDANNIITTLRNLLDPQKSDSLVARKNNIGGELSQNSNPQLNFLFSGDGYETDIKNAQQLYNNNANRLNFDVVSNGLSLWKYLLDRSVLEVRTDMIKAGLSFIQGLNLFVKTDIVSLMENIQPQHPSYNKVKKILKEQPKVIRQIIPAMVSLVNGEAFDDNDSLKLIVVSSLSDIDVAGIVNKMVYKTSSAQSNFVQLPSMKNTVVVYQEYGNLLNAGDKVKVFNPLLHLSYQSQVLDGLKKKIENNQFNSSMRLAYIDTKTLLDTDNIKIK